MISKHQTNPPDDGRRLQLHGVALKHARPQKTAYTEAASAFLSCCVFTTREKERNYCAYCRRARMFLFPIPDRPFNYFAALKSVVQRS